MRMSDRLLERPVGAEEIAPTQYLVFHEGDPDEPIARLHDESVLVPREGSTVELGKMRLYGSDGREESASSEDATPGDAPPDVRTSDSTTFRVVDVDYEYVLAEIFATGRGDVDEEDGDGESVDEESVDEEGVDGPEPDATKLISAALVEVRVADEG